MLKLFVKTRIISGKQGQFREDMDNFGDNKDNFGDNKDNFGENYSIFRENETFQEKT